MKSAVKINKMPKSSVLKRGGVRKEGKGEVGIKGN